MNYEWILNQNDGSMELIEMLDYQQKDSMPKTERFTIGGVVVVDEEYYCGWGLNNLGHRVQIRARFNQQDAQCDVEEFLMFLKRLPVQLTQRPAKHEETH